MAWLGWGWVGLVRLGWVGWVGLSCSVTLVAGLGWLGFLVG